jgi:hypothetical protein
MRALFKKIGRWLITIGLHIIGRWLIAVGLLVFALSFYWKMLGSVGIYGLIVFAIGFMIVDHKHPGTESTEK